MLSFALPQLQIHHLNYGCQNNNNNNNNKLMKKLQQELEVIVIKILSQPKDPFLLEQ